MTIFPRKILQTLLVGLRILWYMKNEHQTNRFQNTIWPISVANIDDIIAFLSNQIEKSTWTPSSSILLVFVFFFSFSYLRRKAISCVCRKVARKKKKCFNKQQENIIKREACATMSLFQLSFGQRMNAKWQWQWHRNVIELK